MIKINFNSNRIGHVRDNIASNIGCCLCNTKHVDIYKMIEQIGIDFYQLLKLDGRFLESDLTNLIDDAYEASMNTDCSGITADIDTDSTVVNGCLATNLSEMLQSNYSSVHTKNGIGNNINFFDDILKRYGFLSKILNVSHKEIHKFFLAYFKAIKPIINNSTLLRHRDWLYATDWNEHKKILVKTSNK